MILSQSKLWTRYQCCYEICECCSRHRQHIYGNNTWVDTDLHLLIVRKHGECVKV